MYFKDLINFLANVDLFGCNLLKRYDINSNAIFSLFHVSNQIVGQQVSNFQHLKFIFTFLLLKERINIILKKN